MADETPAQAPAPGLTSSWLHTLLAHHVAVLALGGALGGAVQPVWQEIKARRAGVAASQLQAVETQRQLWEKNVACLTERGVWETDAPGGVTLAVSLCASGDLLVRYKVQGQETTYTWVALPPPDKLKPYHGR